MKTRFTVTLLALLFSFAVYAQQNHFSYNDSWGKAGYNLTSSDASDVEVTYSVTNFSLTDQVIKGERMLNVELPGYFLPNDEGAPNLPGGGRYIAIPKGATPVLTIVAQRTETIHNVSIAPSPRIPLDNEKGEMIYEKDQKIYSKNAPYPAKPIQLSEVSSIRGVDVVILGITPFQYNPITKDLIVYKDVKVKITFKGGKSHFGEDRLRSRYWDPIMEDNILNFSSLPKIDYNKQIADSYKNKDSREQGCEYLIIRPTNAEFGQWADSIRMFRTRQGILTKVVTITEVGGNTPTAIETYINNAYNTWTIVPAACLMMADHGTDATKNLAAQTLNDHPGGYNPYISDNPYADVTGDLLPDICFSRLTANTPAQLQTLCTKFLNYERNPPTNPDFYDHPITALGWQTERWFQLCSEIVGGFMKDVLGKNPVRINAVYQGNPNVDPWSTATNTSTIVNYFGPNGLGYIPATPQSLGGWTGGTATGVNNAINSGAFMLQHRDHGYYQGWGEPAYSNANVNGLTNTDLTFVFTINCETGAFNYGGNCLGEAFHRYTYLSQNSGALGFVGPTETSYSFVNDTYAWGMYDNMWPNFMPAYGTTPESRDFRPCFGNVAGKYFLQQSNWPSSTYKAISYKLFHHHGDCFNWVYWSVPQQLSVSHDTVISVSANTFTVNATPGSFIALTVGDQIIGTATATIGATIINITPQPLGTTIWVTITKQNYYRYSKTITVGNPLTANFTADITGVCEGGSVNFSDQSAGNATSWNWTFEGGNPSSSTEQNPTNIVYPTSGIYDVTLVISDGSQNDTIVKTDYITVNYNLPVGVTVTADPAGEVCQATSVTFTATPVNGGTTPSYQWKKNGVNVGTNSPTYTYTAVNNDVITCVLTSNSECATGNPATSDPLTMTVIPNVPVSVSIAAVPGNEVCAGTSVVYTATPTNGGAAPVYQWKVNGVNTGNNSNTFEYTPAQGDAITCDLTSDIQCTTGNPAISNTINMTVNENVAVAVTVAAEPSGTVCEGTQVTFTATPENGGSNPVYQWSVNGTIVGENQNTYAYAPATGDVVTCQLTSSITCTNGNPAVSVPVTMDITPNLPVSIAISSDFTAVCTGTTVNFTATPVNEGIEPVYQWNVNGIPTGENANTFSYIPANGDIVTCVLTSSEICTSNNPATSNEVTLSVNDPASVSVSIAADLNSICSGQNVTITATPVNGGDNPAYVWKLNGNVVGDNGATYSSTALANGDVVKCELTSSQACVTGNPATSEAISFTVNNIPDAPAFISPITTVDVAVIPTSNFTISETANTDSYNWAIDPTEAGEIAGNGTQAVVTWSSSFRGDAIVSALSVNECGESVATETTVNVINTYGINENENLGLKLYPNPTNGKFYLEITSLVPGNYTIRIANTLGNIVYENKNVHIDGKNIREIDLSNLADGMYFLLIEGNNASLTSKILFQK